MMWSRRVKRVNPKETTLSYQLQVEMDKFGFFHFVHLSFVTTHFVLFFQSFTKKFYVRSQKYCLFSSISFVFSLNNRSIFFSLDSEKRQRFVSQKYPSHSLFSLNDTILHEKCRFLEKKLCPSLTPGQAQGDGEKGTL